MIKVGSATNIGRVKSRNEDFSFFNAENGIFILCDGMGGHLAGDVASSTATEEIYSNWQKGLSLKDSVLKANDVLLEKSTANEELSGMGTTVLALDMHDDGTYELIWVGDSRMYLFSANKLVQLTEDHTFINFLLLNGMITQEESIHHPNKSVLLQALGGAGTPITPGVLKGKLKKGDILLLCSDGLSNEITEENLKNYLIDYQDGDMQSLAEFLVNQANENGGQDNITAMLIKRDN